jgi:hypothetical protein
MPKEKNSASDSNTDADSKSQPQTPALPPPDNPLRRANEFDADREFKSREMAEKRLEAIKKTREMPTSDNETTVAEDKPSTREP